MCPRSAVRSDELLFVKLRYKQPDSDESTLLEVPLKPERGHAPSNELKWASSVAMFGLLLRNSQHRGTATFDDALQLAKSALGPSPDEQRVEFIDLVLRAGEMATRRSPEVRE